MTSGSNTMSAREARYIRYRQKVIADQLRSARIRVLHLEREAARYGMTELLEEKP